MTIDLISGSHRRLNALTGEWVLVSPGRLQRPWQGGVEARPPAPPAYDPSCYLCPGNLRAGGVRNPDYVHTFLFANDYPALSPAKGEGGSRDPLFGAEPVSGECQVVCYSPRHDLHLGQLDQAAVVAVIEAWTSAWQAYDGGADIAYALIFENRGAMMGASNPHPHGQIWSTSHLPDLPARELKMQQVYHDAHGRPLLADYLERELALDQRIVWKNETWCALVPYWAEWPFELLLLPMRPVDAFTGLEAPEQQGLAQALRQIVRLYDGVFDTPFPYSMGWHSRPTDGQPHPEWVLHAHFNPPLLRSASVRKHQVGFEMFGMKQRDISPESAAATLSQSAQANPV